ncbi:Hypothetical protein PHPALM_2227 [Phytophthora palmivora]|uniref:Uncharacterized protein n=1 Tax=Phytophthora palmivora TaxID=4796 RepID=A0A2P4YQI1_9STRA|nr:Hypothetical protein PHPALM_2227 [Phytophthora palmivora]
MATVAEIFSETCRLETEDGCIGGDYKTAMKMIEQGEAESMEQSIRFTVLDPLQARLERYDQLRELIKAWDKLAAESKMLRAVTLKMQSSRLEDDDKRIQTELDLHQVAEALHKMEAALLPQLEDALQSGTDSTNDLFNTTRLQTALFFRNANQSVLSSLSQDEQETVAETNQSIKFSSRLSKMSSLASDGWTEVDGSNSSTAPDGVEAISGSDEDDECNGLSITLEDFEAGRVPQVHQPEDEDAKVEIVRKPADTQKLVTLASYPVIIRNDADDKEAQGKYADGAQSNRTRRSTSPSPRAGRSKQITPQRTASMFSSIRKTIRGKLSYATGETRIIRQSSAPIIDTLDKCAANSPRKSCEQLVIIPQSPTEWLAIEDCMWEIDVRDVKSPGKSVLAADSISSDACDLLSGLLTKDDSLYFECLSYLRVEDLACLSKVGALVYGNLPTGKRILMSMLSN